MPKAVPVRAQFHQRGVAGLVFLAVFVIVLVGVLTTAFGNRSVQNEFDAKTYPVLATAKEALIAYAVSHPTARGRLPCADTDNDGAENCPPGATDQLGRLPWKTLGLPMPRDGVGECLWYAVSGNFREVPLSTPINSDANGRFGIVDDVTPINNVLAGATAESLAIAVIFAPGSSLGSNDRQPPPPSATAEPCGGNINPANYLDIAPNTVNNAVLAPSAAVPLATATFVVGTPSPTFNDRLAYITPAELFPRVERRVAREIAKTLRAYFTANGAYPFANNYTGPANVDCTAGATRGLLPRRVSANCISPADWLPQWVLDDEWYKVTYYTVDPSCVTSTPTCSSGTLTALYTPPPTNNKEALILMAGRKLSSQSRPCGSVSDCLEGSVNTSVTDTYESRPRAPTFNDVLVIVAP